MAKFGCLGIPAALFLLADVSLPMAMETTRVSLEPPGSSPSAKTPGWSGTWQRLKSRFMPSFLSNGLKRSKRRGFRESWTWLRALPLFLVLGWVISVATSVATLNSVSDQKLPCSGTPSRLDHRPLILPVRAGKIKKKEVAYLCPTVKPSYFDWIFGGDSKNREEFATFKENAKLDIVLSQLEVPNGFEAEAIRNLKKLYDKRVDEKLKSMLKEAEVEGRNCFSLINPKDELRLLDRVTKALTESGKSIWKKFQEEADKRIAALEQEAETNEREDKIGLLEKQMEQAGDCIAGLIQSDLRKDFPGLVGAESYIGEGRPDRKQHKYDSESGEVVEHYPDMPSVSLLVRWMEDWDYFEY